jgi:formate dehydrogenase
MVLTATLIDDYQRLTPQQESELGVKYHSKLEDLVKECDVITINAPLHPGTEHLFNAKLLSSMKKGAYLVNTGWLLNLRLPSLNHIDH